MSGIDWVEFGKMCKKMEALTKQRQLEFEKRVQERLAAEDRRNNADQAARETKKSEEKASERHNKAIEIRKDDLRKEESAHADARTKDRDHHHAERAKESERHAEERVQNEEQHEATRAQEAEQMLEVRIQAEKQHVDDRIQMDLNGSQNGVEGHVEQIPEVGEGLVADPVAEAPNAGIEKEVEPPQASNAVDSRGSEPEPDRD